jgi:hypothetical protein
MKFFIFFSLWVFSINLGATPKPTKMDPGTLRLKIVYGQKISLFVISRKGTGGQIQYVNSTGSRGQRDITAMNYDFLKTKLIETGGPANNRDYCKRNYIELTSVAHSSIGCMGSPTKTARTLQETANLLSTMF